MLLSPGMLRKFLYLANAQIGVFLLAALFCLSAPLAVQAQALNADAPVQKTSLLQSDTKAAQADRLCQDANVVLKFGDDYAEAIRKLTEAINLCPTESKYWHALGTAYSYKGDLEQAIIVYEKACAMNPTEKSWKEELERERQRKVYYTTLSAVAWRERKCPKAAIAECESGLKVVDDPTLRFLVAVIYRQELGNVPKAVEECEHALRVSQYNYPDIHLFLADMYRELGNIPKATEHYKKAGAHPSQESTPVKPTN